MLDAWILEKAKSILGVVVKEDLVGWYVTKTDMEKWYTGVWDLSTPRYTIFFIFRNFDENVEIIAITIAVKDLIVTTKYVLQTAQ